MMRRLLAGGLFGLLMTGFVTGEGCTEQTKSASPVSGPEVVEKGDVAKTTREKNQLNLGDFDLEVLFLTIASGEHTTTDGNDYAMRALEIPLIRSTERRKDTPEDSKRVYLDLPLFRLLSVDTTDLVDYDVKFIELPFIHMIRVADESGLHRSSLGKLGLMTLFDRLEGIDYHRGHGTPGETGMQWEAVRNPFFRLISGTDAENEQRFGFLTSRSAPGSGDSRFALLESYSKKHLDDYSTVRIGETWLLDTFRLEQDNSASRLELIDCALFSLVRSQITADGETNVEFLRLPLKTRLLGYEQDSDKSSSFSFLRMPILGSAFRHSTNTEDNDLKILFLPVY